MVKVCTIGAGTAQASLLQSLEQMNEITSLSGIICTTDNGGSSAVVRSSLDMPSPGDSRNCLNHLQQDDVLLRELLNYRFSSGELQGTHLGNLILGALTQLKGGLNEAVQAIQKELTMKTKIIPVSNSPTQICAQLEDGSTVEGERHIIKRDNPNDIKSVFLKNEITQAHPNALAALRSADIIIISPGVLATGIVSPLLHGGMKEAISQNSSAQIIYFINKLGYPSQSTGRTAQQHIDFLHTYLPRSVNHVIIDTTELPAPLLEYYLKKGHDLVDHKDIEGSFHIHRGSYISFPGYDYAGHERSSNAQQHIGPHLITCDTDAVSDLMRELI